MWCVTNCADKRERVIIRGAIDERGSRHAVHQVCPCPHKVVPNPLDKKHIPIKFPNSFETKKWNTNCVAFNSGLLFSRRFGLLCGDMLHTTIIDIRTPR